MSVSVTQINIDSLSAEEAAAIHAAEAEAEAFYNDIEANIQEGIRLSELREVCRLMVIGSTPSVIAAHLESVDVFMDTEKAILNTLAGQHKDNCDPDIYGRKITSTIKVNNRDKSLLHNDYTFYEIGMTAKLIASMA